MRRYPYKGKFEGEPIVVPLLYEYAQLGADEECGDIQEHGFYAWLFEGNLKHLFGPADLAAHDLYFDEADEVCKHAGVILVENSHGFVHAYFHVTEDQLRQHWRMLEFQCVQVSDEMPTAEDG